MEICKYSSNFDENVRTVQTIEEILLKDLIQSLKLPADFYKSETNKYSNPIRPISESSYKQVLNMLNHSV
jgi:hypothetical protein